MNIPPIPMLIILWFAVGILLSNAGSWLIDHWTGKKRYAGTPIFIAYTAATLFLLINIYVF